MHVPLARRPSLRRPHRHPQRHRTTRAGRPPPPPPWTDPLVDRRPLPPRRPLRSPERVSSCPVILVSGETSKQERLWGVYRTCGDQGWSGDSVSLTRLGCNFATSWPHNLRWLRRVRHTKPSRQPEKQSDKEKRAPTDDTPAYVLPRQSTERMAPSPSPAPTPRRHAINADLSRSEHAPSHKVLLLPPEPRSPSQQSIRHPTSGSQAHPASASHPLHYCLLPLYRSCLHLQHLSQPPAAQLHVFLRSVLHPFLASPSYPSAPFQESPATPRRHATRFGGSAHAKLNMAHQHRRPRSSRPGAASTPGPPWISPVRRLSFLSALYVHTLLMARTLSSPPLKKLA